MTTMMRRYATLIILSVLATPTAWAQGGGPIAWWEAEGNCFDSIGTNDGTMMNGATYGDGVWGQSFSFDGSDDYAAVPDSVDFDLVDALTVAFWVRVDSCTHGQGWCNLVSKSPDGWVSHHHFGVAIQRSGGKMTMFIGSGSSQCFEYAGPDLRDGLWHHVAASYDEAVMRYFVDGFEVHTVACSLPLTPNSEDLEIGAESGEPGLAAFGGEIDDVMVFDYVLSEAEIKSFTTIFEDGFESGDTGQWR